MVLGASPWGSPWGAWARLVGLTTYGDGDTKAQRRGRILEPALLAWHASEIGEKIHPGPTIAEDPWTADDDWRHARPDGFYSWGRIPAPGLVLVEVKTTRDWTGWGAEGTDQVPPWYAVQVLWQQQVALDMGEDVERSELIAFSPMTEDIRVYRFPVTARSRALSARLTERVRDWYDRHVRTGEPPAVDDSAECRAAIGLRFARTAKEWKQPTDADVLMIANLRRLRAARDAAESLVKSAENAIRLALGTAYGFDGLIRAQGASRALYLLDTEPTGD